MRDCRPDRPTRGGRQLVVSWPNSPSLPPLLSDPATPSPSLFSPPATSPPSLRQPGRLAGDGEAGLVRELVDQQTDQPPGVSGVKVLQSYQDLGQVASRPHALYPGRHSFQEEAVSGTRGLDDLDKLSDPGGEETGQQLDVRMVGEDREVATPDDLPGERGCRSRRWRISCSSSPLSSCPARVVISVA